MKYLITTIISLIILFALTAVVTAQPGLPGDPAQAPVDGGLGLLAVAGGAYAYKMLKNKNEERDLE